MVSLALVSCCRTHVISCCTASCASSKPVDDRVGDNSVEGVRGNLEVPGAEVCDLLAEMLQTWLSDGWGSNMFHENPGKTQASPLGF